MTTKPVLLLLTMSILPMSIFAQGSLTPPGPPAATMKSLDQIDAKLEKRTPISSLPFTISQPGSYYLTQNLTGSASGGITITAQNVTLDLNGFTLDGNRSSATGINIPNFDLNVRVRNGIISDWGGGGIRAFDTIFATFEDLTVWDCGGVGLLAGSRCLVRRCVANNTGFNFGAHGPGIQTAEGCAVLDCVSSSNFAEGFSLGYGVLISNCSAFNNISDGIKVIDGSTVSNCTSYNNSTGIRAGVGSTVANCTARSNTTGILVTGGCNVTGNTADYSATAFSITGDGNRVDHNTGSVFQGSSSPAFAISGNGNCVDNNMGSVVGGNGSAAFVITGNSNLIIRNSARATGTNQFPISGSNNTIGFVIDVHATGGTISNHEAWANFVY